LGWTILPSSDGTRFLPIRTAASVEMRQGRGPDCRDGCGL